MGFSRSDRIAEEIKKYVSQIINTELKDPRIDGLISVTKVDVTKDLRNAKIFISLYGDENTKAEVFEVIKNASSFIRRELASKIRVKFVPEICFKLDDSIEYSVHIHKLIEEVSQQDLEENKEK